MSSSDNVVRLCEVESRLKPTRTIVLETAGTSRSLRVSLPEVSITMWAVCEPDDDPHAAIQDRLDDRFSWPWYATQLARECWNRVVGSQEVTRS